MWAGYDSFTTTQNFLNSNPLTSKGKVVEFIKSKSSSRRSNNDIYTPVIEFKTKDGLTIEFTASIGRNPPAYSKGETVEVIYLESFPEQAKINSYFSLWSVSIIFGGIGSIFFLTGFSMLILKILRDRKIEYLRENGIQVTARFQSVKVNRFFSVNRRNPHRICVRWKNPDTELVEMFNSEYIWFDPTDYVDIGEVTVLIEKDNLKKHYVDISFLFEA